MPPNCCRVSWQGSSGRERVAHFPLIILSISQFTWPRGHNFTTATALSSSQVISLRFCSTKKKKRKTTYQKIICFPVKTEWEAINEQTMPVRIHSLADAGTQVTSQTWNLHAVHLTLQIALQTNRPDRNVFLGIMLFPIHVLIPDLFQHVVRDRSQDFTYVLLISTCCFNLCAVFHLALCNITITLTIMRWKTSAMFVYVSCSEV